MWTELVCLGHGEESRLLNVSLLQFRIITILEEAVLDLESLRIENVNVVAVEAELVFDRFKVVFEVGRGVGLSEPPFGAQDGGDRFHLNVGVLHVYF